MSTRKLPNFVVIGAPKSGTTSLFYYLKQHPEVFLPEQKELHFFSYPYLAENANGPGDKVVLNDLCKTIEGYERHFSRYAGQPRSGDFSPSYLYYSDCSTPMRETLGEIKIVAMLRNPVDKAYSQYMHLIRENRETLTFLEALEAEQERASHNWSDIWRYAESSLYFDRLMKYVDVFGKENIKVVVFEEFTQNPQNSIVQICKFLGISENFAIDTSKQYNRTGQPKSKLVSDFFSRDNTIKSVAKRLIPDKVRIDLRNFLINLNTGNKPEIDPAAIDYLNSYFERDIVNLERWMGTRLPWGDR